MKVIFDTNIFSKILSGQISINDLNNNEINVIVTHIQLDELRNCSDQQIKEGLLNIVSEMQPETIPTESFILGVSRLGMAKLGSKDNIFDKLRKDNFKHTNDALIGEVAILQKILLLTNDHKLKMKVKSLGGSSQGLEEFKLTKLIK